VKDWNASGVTDYPIAVGTRPAVNGDAGGARFSHDHGNSAPWADFEWWTIVGGRDHGQI
jgi:hypothetical protein